MSIEERLADAVDRRGGEALDKTDRPECVKPSGVPCPQDPPPSGPWECWSKCEHLQYPPKPAADNAAWLKAWLLADEERARELVDVILTRAMEDNTIDCVGDHVLHVLRLTEAELWECLLEAEGKAK